jgi:hypothetical protein
MSPELMREWYAAVPRPAEGLSSAWGDDVEWPVLHECLTGAGLMTDREISWRDFGSIGDAMCILSAEQFLWFLPHLIRGLADPNAREESVWVSALVRGFAEAVTESDRWDEIRPRLSLAMLEALRGAFAEAWPLLDSDEEGKEHRPWRKAIDAALA